MEGREFWGREISMIQHGKIAHSSWRGEDQDMGLVGKIILDVLLFPAGSHLPASAIRYSAEAEDSAKIRYLCVSTMSSESRHAAGPWDELRNEFISLCHGPGKKSNVTNHGCLGNAVAFPAREGNHTY